ncbi:MAG: DUF3987 domain-containing protein [Bacteroidota bacterium]
MMPSQQTAPPNEVLFSTSHTCQQSVIKFPLSIFPDVVTDYIKACKQSLNLVPDFMGLGVISAVATLIGNSYQIQIKPGWVERPLLWFALVGHSGIRKTPSLSAALRPLMKLDHQHYETYCKALQAFQAKDAPDGKKPLAKQLIANGTTIEALLNILKENPNGILYHKDELIGWINDLARYNTGSAEQQWLSIYSNQSIRVNRKKDDQHLLIPRPFVNVIGGIQPEVLHSLYKEDRKANGFTSRIAFSFPDDVPRTISKSEMDTTLVEEYENFIDRFSYISKKPVENGLQGVINLSFSADAQKRFYEWDETFINRQLNISQLSAPIKSVISKLEAMVPRVALTIEFIDQAALCLQPVCVNVSSVEKAIRLVSYLYDHYLKVHQLIYNKHQKTSTTEHQILTAFTKEILVGRSKEQAVKMLLHIGYRNGEIAQALRTAKTNINYWANK